MVSTEPKGQKLKISELIFKINSKQRVQYNDFQFICKTYFQLKCVFITH